MSLGRIATTHVGSLPRGPEVTDLIFAKERGEAIDEARFSAVIAAAVDETVARQVAAGIDLVSDGEMSKISYATYIKDRITGFEGDSPRSPPSDLEAFPSFLERQAKGGGTPTYRRPKCVAEVKPKTLAPLDEDIAHLKAALAAHPPAVGAFMNAASPGVIALFQPNEYYPTREAYLEALAEAMRPEYEAIVAAGLILQLDSPDLGLGRHMMYKDRPEADYLGAGRRRTSRRSITPCATSPPIGCGCTSAGATTRGRTITTWRWRRSCPLLMRAKPAGLLFETSNPRHQHDWAAFEDSRRTSPRTRCSSRACSTPRRTSSSTPRWSPSGSRPSPTSSAATG